MKAKEDIQLSQLFGQAVAQMREAANLSRGDLAEKMAWRGTAPVIEIEKGRRIPRPATIDKLVEVLKGSFAQQCYLRGLAGLLPSPAIPSAEQIIGELGLIARQVRQSFYPVIITDNRFTFWMMNPAATRLYGNLELLEQVVRYMATQNRYITVLDAFFDSRLGGKERLDKNGAYFFLKERVHRFQIVNILQQHTVFYRSYPECMRERLLPKDYQLFEEIWGDATKDLHTRIEERQKVTEQELKQRSDIEMGTFDFKIPPDNEEDQEVKIKARLITQPIFRLGNFFEYTTYLPDPDPENLERTEQVFAKYRTTDKGCLQLWDVTDVTPLIRQYKQEAEAREVDDPSDEEDIR